jgi:hypothetical protein
MDERAKTCIRLAPVGGHSGGTLAGATGKTALDSPGDEKQRSSCADICEEFVQRLGRLEPVLTQLENLALVKGTAPQPAMSPDPPDRWELVTYLVYLLVLPAIEPTAS